MIQVSRLDGTPYMISAHQIETMEAVPDTVLTFVSGRKQIVREPLDEIVRRVVAFHRRIHRPGGGDE